MHELLGTFQIQTIIDSESNLLQPSRQARKATVGREEEAATTGYRGKSCLAEGGDHGQEG
jgi:hypothetical protein